MTTFLLVPGAGGASAYWHRVVPLLEEAGHETIALELPGVDDSKGLPDYVELAVEAIDARKDVVLVAQSLGGFTAPLVATKAPAAVRGIVFVNAMIPTPGETAGAWWGNTGSEEARRLAAKAHGYSPDFDLATYFLHDLGEDDAKAVMSDARPQSKKIFGDACAFDHWPEVAIRVIVGTEDRFFPRDFQHRVAKERLGGDVRIDDIRGGHLVALSNPKELVERVLDFTAK